MQPGLWKIRLFALMIAAAALGSACVSPLTQGIEVRLAPSEPPVSKEESTAALSEVLTERAPLLFTEDPVEAFDAAKALAHARALASMGARPGGSEAELKAAEYVDDELRQLGYATRIDTFALPNGRTSRNVVAVAPGSESTRAIVVGAHLDSKPPSPGANDNASGCGVALELARQFAERPAPGTVRFVFFGTEEYLADVSGDYHHLGSRFDAAQLSEAAVANTAAMFSIDMVGYGDRALVRSMGRGPLDLVEIVRSEAKRQRLKLAYRRDPGPTGWSDHEAYELRDIPVAWLEWPDDPAYHTVDDDADHLQREPMETAGKLVLGTIRRLGARELDEFCDR